MESQPITFAIMHQREPDGRSELLVSVRDANEATITFHQLWSQLSKQHRRGEVVLARRDPDETVLLRLPLNQLGL